MTPDTGQPKVIPIAFKVAPTTKCAESTCHDPPHGWVNGTQVRSPSFLAMQQLFGPIILEYNSSVPVTVVTRLLIRRQFRRYLMPSSLEKLLSQLVCLTDIIYEQWSIMYTYAFPGFYSDFPPLSAYLNLIVGI